MSFLQQYAEDPPFDDIDVLIRGAPLLKFGRTGNAHFREFQLSADLQSLSYVTAKAEKSADGVVRLPSEFSKTSGSPPSMTAMQEVVVPKSMPKTFAIG